MTKMLPSSGHYGPNAQFRRTALLKVLPVIVTASAAAAVLVGNPGLVFAGMVGPLVWCAVLGFIWSREAVCLDEDALWSKSGGIWASVGRDAQITCTFRRLPSTSDFQVVPRFNYFDISASQPQGRIYIHA